MTKKTRKRRLSKRRLLVAWAALGIFAPLSWICYRTFGPRPPIEISYKTTRITSPLTEDGYADYAGHVLESYPHSVESLPAPEWQLPELKGTPYVDVNFPLVPASPNDERDQDRYWAEFERFYQRIESAPISRFSHPTTAMKIAANRNWYEQLEAALLKPMVIATDQYQYEGPERTLAFDATSGPDAGSRLASRINLHIGERQQGEAFRVIDCLRRAVERRLEAPVGNQPYSDVLRDETRACRGAMMAALVASQLGDDHWEWIQSLPTERPLPEITNGIDINIRFYCLDYLQHLHRKPETEWKSWNDFHQFTAKRIHEPIQWNAIARGINTAIDAVIEGLPAADTFATQKVLYLKHLELMAECEWAEIEIGKDFPYFVSFYFNMYFEYANKLAAVYRQTHLVFELSEWRRAHGHFPDQLTDLPIRSKRIEIAMQDPFNGEPMKYERTEKSFRLYSVGPNREDDFGIEQPDQIPPSFRSDGYEDIRTGRRPDDLIFGWPPLGVSRAGR